MFATLVAVAALTGCGSDGGDSTVVKTVTESTIGQTSTTTATESGAPKPVSLPTLHLTQFQTPSHNIGCYMSTQAGGFVRCDIRERSWRPPPKPAYCDVDWGQGIQVGKRRPGQFVCPGDTVLDPGAPVLPYGQASQAGAIRCRGTKLGLICGVRKTGHGFFIARGRYDLF